MTTDTKDVVSETDFEIKVCTDLNASEKNSASNFTLNICDDNTTTHTESRQDIQLEKSFTAMGGTSETRAKVLTEFSLQNIEIFLASADLSTMAVDFKFEMITQRIMKVKN